MRILKAAACAALLSLVGTAAANAAVVNSFDSGWYTDSGFTAGVKNINVGSSNLSGAVYHNFLAFNLSGLSGQTITGATLTFNGGNGVNTSSDTETLGLFDYTGSINQLLSAQFNVGVWTDLGNGNSYGTANVAPGAIGAFSIALNQDALNGLNAAAMSLTDNRFAIGGSLLSISGPFANEQLFAIFGPGQALNSAAFLTLQTAPVPEPSTLAMFLGLGGAAMLVRRRQKKSKTLSA